MPSCVLPVCSLPFLSLFGRPRKVPSHGPRLTSGEGQKGLLPPLIVCLPPARFPLLAVFPPSERKKGRALFTTRNNLDQPRRVKPPATTRHAVSDTKEAHRPHSPSPPHPGREYTPQLAFYDPSSGSAGFAMAHVPGDGEPHKRKRIEGADDGGGGSPGGGGGKPTRAGGFGQGAPQPPHFGMFSPGSIAFFVRRSSFTAMRSRGPDSPLSSLLPSKGCASFGASLDCFLRRCGLPLLNPVESTVQPGNLPVSVVLSVVGHVSRLVYQARLRLATMWKGG